MQAAIVLVMMSLLVGCAGGDEPAPTWPEADSSSSTAETAEGKAAVELRVEPTEVDGGEQVTVQLANRGEVSLMTSPRFMIERWDGNVWIEVPFPDDYGFGDVQEPLLPGEGTTPHAWPVYESDQPEPGWYRATQSALWDDEPEFIEPEIELSGQARFEVNP